MNCKIGLKFSAAAIALLFATAVGLPTAKAQVIDLGSFGGHEYFYDTGSYVSFDAASLAAQTLVGGQLVSITSAAENNFLISAITPFASSQLAFAWTGLTRPTSNDPFGWVSGEPFTYSNWRPAGVGETFAEPTNGSGETNGGFYVNSNNEPQGPVPVGYWFDTFSVNSDVPFNAIYEVVPEPSTWVCVTLGGVLVLVVEARFGKSKRQS